MNISRKQSFSLLENKPLTNHKKSLMFKYIYGRMQKKIPSWLVCSSHGACLDCILLGVQVTTWLGFLCSSHVAIRGGSRLLKRGGTTRPVIIVNVGLVRYLHS